MKKILSLLLVLILALGVLAGCSSGKDSGSKETPNGVVEENGKNNDSIEVDKNLTSIEITLPETLLSMDDEEIDYDEIISSAKKEEGIKDVTKNDDGSITYKMSKARHKEMMNEISDDILESFDELINDEDFESIKDITSNEKYSEIEVAVDKAKYENSFDGLGVLGVAMQSMFYQLYNGVDPDSYEVIVNFKDDTTGEVFDTITYPDALNQ